MPGCKKEFTIKWIIENYTLCDRKNGCFFISPKFKAEHFGGSEWNFLLYPRGVDMYSYENICLHIWRVPFKKEELSIDLDVNICSSEGDVFLTAERKIHFKTGGEYSFPKGLKSEEIEKKMANSLKDTLVVRCRMKMEERAAEKYTTEINYSAKTTIDFDRYSFMWDLEYDESSDMLMKRTFVGMNETQFEITLRALEDDVLIVIERTRENSRRCPAVKCHIILINCEGIEITSYIGFYFFDSDSDERNLWSFPTFFKKSLLAEHVWLSIKFTFIVSNGIKVSRHIQEYECF